MNKETEQSAPKSEDFEKRHGEELGVKKFAKVQATYTFLPLLTAAAGAALGYYALARPIAKLIPKINKATAIGEAGLETLSKSIGQFARDGDIMEAFKKFNPNEEQVAKLKELWLEKPVAESEKALGESEKIPSEREKAEEKPKKPADNTNKLEKTAEILNIKLPDVSKTVRVSSSAGAGFLGLMGGSIAVGYDQWRKEESARLAAKEINQDIANLELFRPSDPELMAENKRLSSMVAALPTIETATVEKQGRVKENQQAASI